MKQSIKDRIRVTTTGKILRRPMGIGHSKARKSRRAQHRKEMNRPIGAMDLKTFKRYF